METTVVATRVDKTLYGKILKRQRAVKKLTGIEPTIGAVVRALLQEALSKRAKAAA